jgi:hypothetical protein
MYSLWLMTAAWTAGAPVDSPPAYYAPVSQPQMVQVISPSGAHPMPAYSGTAASSPGGQAVSPYHSVPAQPTTPLAALPGSMPGQPSLNPMMAGQPVPVPTMTRVLNSHAPESAPTSDPGRMGHEADYSRITGYLYYVHTDGGRWLLRYATLDQVDRYGGSVVLIPCMEMGKFREGDLVTVRGAVLNEGRTSRSLGGALYRTQMIELVERR